MGKIRSLLLSANPQTMDKLGLDIETREITKNIRLSHYRDSLEIIGVWAVRPDDLLQSLNAYKPEIVHFSGHGSSSGEIIFLDKNDKPKPVSVTALKKLFTALKDNIQLIILNACYSEAQAAALAEVIDCTIGISDQIEDEAATIFTAAFYRAIGFGRSIQDAFDQGIAALLIEEISEDQMPKLIVKKGVNPASIFLITPPDDSHLPRITPSQYEVKISKSPSISTAETNYPQQPQADTGTDNNKLNSQFSAIKVESQKYSATAGDTITISIVIYNRLNQVDHFSLSVDGIPNSWVETMPSPRVDISGSVNPLIHIHVPRSPESKAGKYPISIQLTSMLRQQIIDVVETELTVQPYYEFECELRPAQIEIGSPAEVIVINHGNVQQRFQLWWQISSTAIRFEPDAITVNTEAGEQASISFQTLQRRRQSGNLYDFSIEVSSFGYGVNLPPKILKGRVYT